jgi:hypothetical protein
MNNRGSLAVTVALLVLSLICLPRAVGSANGTVGTSGQAPKFGTSQATMSLAQAGEQSEQNLRKSEEDLRAAEEEYKKAKAAEEEEEREERAKGRRPRKELVEAGEHLWAAYKALRAAPPIYLGHRAEALKQISRALYEVQRSKAIDRQRQK